MPEAVRNTKKREGK